VVSPRTSGRTCERLRLQILLKSSRKRADRGEGRGTQVVGPHLTLPTISTAAWDRSDDTAIGDCSRGRGRRLSISRGLGVDASARRSATARPEQGVLKGQRRVRVVGILISIIRSTSSGLARGLAPPHGGMTVLVFFTALALPEVQMKPSPRPGVLAHGPAAGCSSRMPPSGTFVDRGALVL